MRDRFQGAPASGFIVSAAVKLGLMCWGIRALMQDRGLFAVTLVAAIVLVTGIERLWGSVHNRAFAGVINRFAYLPVLLYLAAREIQSDPRFPILVVLAVGFIVIKEIAFLFNGIRFLMRTEQYMAPKSMRGLNAVALLAVIALFALHLEPAASLSLIAVVVISIADASGFAWNFYKKKNGLRDINLATKITLMRLLMSPVFMIVYFYDRNANFGDNSLLLQVIAVLLSVLLIATDGLDGYFARKRNEVTKLGKYLDPFSDKICTLTVFLCFVASNYVPVWMVALIFYREAAIDVIRTLAAAENVVISARRSGKWKTGLQGTAIITILMLATVLSELGRTSFTALYPGVYADLLMAWNYVPFTLMALVTVFTVFSGVDYLLSSKNILDKYFK